MTDTRKVAPARPGHELLSKPATVLAQLIRSRDISPVELMEATLARVEALEPTIHAFTAFAPEQALASARAAEAQIMQGEGSGPLHGLPISIKDLLCTTDLPTTSGSKAYAGFMADEDDICVARVKAAGAIVIGKTNVPEFGYAGSGKNALFPTTTNPWDPTKTSGGSSAGSAAAVASGMGSLTIGSDGGGSVRGPASYCGLYGLKPSFGRVPCYPTARDWRHPGVSSWESVEHIGPLTRTVEDAALLMSVMAGPDPRDWHSLPAGDIAWLEAPRKPIGPLRIAYTPDFGFATVDQEVRDVTLAAAQVFASDLGCELVEDSPPFANMFDLFLTIIMRDSDLRGMRALAAEDKIHLPGLLKMLDRPWSAEDFTDATIARQRICSEIARFMANYDLLLTPTVSSLPFSMELFQTGSINGLPIDKVTPSPFTFPFNWTGQPAASIPAGFSRDGLPIGLQIVGRHLADDMVLAASAAFEQVRPWAHVWPDLVHDCG